MKALTLIDDNPSNPTPWATLMEAGIKTDESRTWAISKDSKTLKLPFDCLLTASKSSRTKNAGLAVCVVEIYDCVPLTQEYEDTVCCPAYPGFVFRTRNLRWLSRKFPVKGMMGFFEVEIPADVTLFTPSPGQLAALQLQFGPPVRTRNDK